MTSWQEKAPNNAKQTCSTAVSSLFAKKACQVEVEAMVSSTTERLPQPSVNTAAPKLGESLPCTS